MCERWDIREDDLELHCRACGRWFYSWESCDCSEVASEDLEAA